MGCHARSRSQRQSGGYHSVLAEYRNARDGVAAGIAQGQQLFSFATYNRANKLPYTINDTLDIQWQPRNDLAIEIGYVGNFGRHEVIPDSLQSGGHCHAHSSHPSRHSFRAGLHLRLHGADASSCSPFMSDQSCPTGSRMQANYEGGNVDLRVPYIGYSAESETYKAAGVSAYNALQTHVEKRMSHGLQVGFSYTLLPRAR